MATKPKLSRLRIYPVKAVGGMDVEEWPLDRFGLRYDRRWMVVDASGVGLTLRDHPRLAEVSAEVRGETLILSAPHQPSLELPVEPPPGPAEPVAVGRDKVGALAVSDDANRWLGEWLRTACTLVFLPEGRTRPIAPEYDPGNATLAFADEFPLLLLTTESVDALNARADRPLPVDYFRPNLVVTGAGEPHEEDTWRRIRVSGNEIRLVRPATWGLPRQSAATGSGDAGPFAALASYRGSEDRILFGQHAIHVNTTGEIRVGAPVEVLERGDPPAVGDLAADGPAAPREEEQKTPARRRGPRLRMINLPRRAAKPEASEPRELPPWETEEEATKAEEEATTAEDGPVPGGEPDPWAAADAEAEPEAGAIGGGSPAEPEAASKSEPEVASKSEPEAASKPEPEPPPGAEAAAEPAEPEVGATAGDATSEPEPSPEPRPKSEPEVPAGAAAVPSGAASARSGVEVREGVVPPVDQVARLLTAAAVAESSGDVQRLAAAAAASPVLLTAWRGDALVGLVRGWTDRVRDGFISDVAVHPDHHGEGVAEDLVRRLVALHPPVRWMLRASPGSAYLGSALGWHHAGSGWYLSPR